MEIKNDISYVKSVRCSDVYTESQTDYVLPDYLGDVRKILFSEASLRPSGRFAGGDEVEFSGVIVYNVIYLDGEGGLSSVEFTSDYDYSVKCSGESYNDSVADTRVSNYSIRLVGPRKINAKASVVGSVRLSENQSITVSGDAFEGKSEPEINTGKADLRITRVSSVSEREFAESIANLDGAIIDEVSVIHCGAECIADEIKAEDESVTIKGHLNMMCVIKNGDEPAYGMTKTVPFEENVEFEGLKSTMHILPEMSVSSLKSNVNASENGCEIVLSVIAELCVIAEGNESTCLMLDGYLMDCPTDNCYDNFSYNSLVDLANIKGTHNAEINRSELESECLREIVFMTSTPKIERVEFDNQVATLIGEIRYSGVASEMVGDKISYTGIKFSSPFATNVNINCQNSDNIHIEAEVHTSSTQVSLDADKLYASCTLESIAMAIKEDEKIVLSSMTRCEGESYESDDAKIIVYYPSADETLFSVAKHFRTSSLKLAQDNDITESVFAEDNPTGNLSGVKRLLIY